MALPELAVLEGVGSDVIWASKVQQEEWRPKGNQLVLTRKAVEGEEAQSIYGSGVSQLVCQPEQESQHRGRFTPADAGEDEEDNLQHEAQEHQDLNCPFIPKVYGPSSHCGAPKSTTELEDHKTGMAPSNFDR